eukprot:scaffold1937_cov120-Isochrysis_galbana.AAC.4
MSYDMLHVAPAAVLSPQPLVVFIAPQPHEWRVAGKRELFMIANVRFDEGKWGVKWTIHTSFPYE